LEVDGGALRLTFKNTAGGLKTRDGNAPSHFEIIGVGSNGYRPAEGKIDGDRLILSSAEVTEPRAVRFAWNLLAEPNLCGGTGLPVAAFRAGDEPVFLDSVPTAKEYTMVYDLDLSKLSGEIRYDVDLSSQVGDFDRIGYLVELTDSNGQERKVFVTMKAFTRDVKKIGIPTLASGARFQMPIEQMDIFSSAAGVASGRDIASGNIEFWPDNYGMVNGAHVEGASDSIYDFGDEIAVPPDGYGSMQVHHGKAGQTVFAINQWRAGARADLGIGNSEGNTRDWTFTSNASAWSNKRLRVFVRPVR
jgi:sialate O-acetylesterase